MRILILAIGKSGTTPLLYKIGAARPELQIFSGGRLERVEKIHGDAVFKFTMSENKGRSFNAFIDHLSRVEYDRKIWIARDPRDNAISRVLFRWYRGSKTDKTLYRDMIKMVEQKEQDPKSIPFYELMRYRIRNQEPLTVAEVVETERRSFAQMHRFVDNLGADWFIYKYEDFVDNNFSELNDCLGFQVENDTNIDKHAMKVARKKSTGDWRHWYTEEDVKLFRPVYKPYMDLLGYDSSDWGLHPAQVIEPKYASLYLKSLPRIRRVNTLKKFRKKMARFFVADS
ncbi:MAG: hypothetical protein AB1Z51_03475 [Desulfuromonadales bacterium]